MRDQLDGWEFTGSKRDKQRIEAAVAERYQCRLQIIGVV